MYPSHRTQYREAYALNVYIGLCYYKLDYYDVSQEVLKIYLEVIAKMAIFALLTELRLPFVDFLV